MNIKRLLELVWAGVYIAMVLLAAGLVVAGCTGGNPKQAAGGCIALFILAMICWGMFYDN